MRNVLSSPLDDIVYTVDIDEEGNHHNFQAHSIEDLPEDYLPAEDSYYEFEPEDVNKENLSIAEMSGKKLDWFRKVCAAVLRFLILHYLCRIKRKGRKMKQENNRIQLPLEEIKLAFAASCVEGAARKLGVPYIEIYERMRKVDLINKFILPHYDTLHTESREYLIEDVIECLTNWEKKDR